MNHYEYKTSVGNVFKTNLFSVRSVSGESLMSQVMKHNTTCVSKNGPQSKNDLLATNHSRSRSRSRSTSTSIAPIMVHQSKRSVVKPNRERSKPSQSTSVNSLSNRATNNNTCLSQNTRQIDSSPAAFSHYRSRSRSRSNSSVSNSSRKSVKATLSRTVNKTSRLRTATAPKALRPVAVGHLNVGPIAVVHLYVGQKVAVVNEAILQIFPVAAVEHLTTVQVYVGLEMPLEADPVNDYHIVVAPVHPSVPEAVARKAILRTDFI